MSAQLFSSRDPQARPFASLAMGKKRGAEPAPRGSVASDGSWQAQQQARLEAQSKALSSAGRPTVQAFASALYMPPDQIRPQNVEELRESDQQPVRSFDAAARLLHRRSDAGLLKTSFEPERHAAVVAGRPVQVLPS